MPNYSLGEFAALRRAYIEQRAAATGHVNRPDIAAVFGTSGAQLSADIQQLLTDHPGCLTYDPKKKHYRWTGKKPRLPIPKYITGFNLNS